MASSASAAAAEVPMTPHQVLGVEVGTSVKKIKEKYHELARLYHPDKQPVDASDEERAAQRQKFVAVHAAWESLQKNGFQEREADWEQEEATDSLEKMQERMADLRECHDFAKEQVNILESAIGNFDELVKSQSEVPVPVPVRRQKQVTLLGRGVSDKSVAADLKRGLGPRVVEPVVVPPVEANSINDDLDFLRRLVPDAYAIRSDIWEQILELEGKIAFKVILAGREVNLAEGKRRTAERKAEAAAAGAKQVAEAERQAQAELKQGVTPVFNWGLVEEAKDFAHDVHSLFSGIGSWFASPQVPLPTPEAEEEDNDGGKAAAICDGIVA